MNSKSANVQRQRVKWGLAGRISGALQGQS